MRVYKEAMRVVVAGGTGFLGRPLVERLEREGHEVRVLSRRPSSARDVAWTPDGTVGPWAEKLDGADAVINLAGASIAGSRWTAAHKTRIRDSRIRVTRSLVNAIGQATRRPPVFLSGSAIGYYGPHGDEMLTENAAPGNDFLASVCKEWEAEALRAATGTRVVLLRTGLPLERDGGALPQMALPFRLFAGGPVGSGSQYLSWIHRADWIGLTLWALRTSSVSGPLNLTAPNPVQNREFARTLGRVLRRPAFMPAPAFALRIALGEIADALLLTGQRVVPARAQSHSFEFQYATLEPALRAIYSST
jgi:uncharacterized protein (TIGR01777 family)